MNKVQLCGYLGRDFELRYSKTTGTAIATNSIAITKRWTEADGTKIEHTDWIPIKLFGRTAEVANQYFKQGSQFLCSGELYTDDYIDNHGVTKYVWGVNIKEFYWLNNKREKEEVEIDTNSNIENNAQDKHTNDENLEQMADQEFYNDDFTGESNV